MYKILIIVLVFMTITACNHDDQDTISITGSNTTSFVNESENYDLDITKYNNDITVAKNNNIDMLSLTGSNNLLTIGNNTTVDQLYVSGNDNTIVVPVGSGISMTNEGNGNTIIGL